MKCKVVRANIASKNKNEIIKIDKKRGAMVTERGREGEREGCQGDGVGAGARDKKKDRNKRCKGRGQ